MYLDAVNQYFKIHSQIVDSEMYNWKNIFWMPHVFSTVFLLVLARNNLLKEVTFSVTFTFFSFFLTSENVCSAIWMWPSLSDLAEYTQNYACLTYVEFCLGHSLLIESWKATIVGICDMYVYAVAFWSFLGAIYIFLPVGYAYADYFLSWFIFICLLK